MMLKPSMTKKQFEAHDETVKQMAILNKKMKDEGTNIMRITLTRALEKARLRDG